MEVVLGVRILEKLSIKPFAVVGHRGSAGRLPENTLRSIDYAVGIGVDIVEVDVRSTRDGVLILLHDPDFKRVAGVDVVAKNVEYAWIKDNVRIGGEPVPRLEEVLEFVKNRDIGLFIEVKEPETTRKVLELISMHGVVDRVAVISFYDDALTITKRLNPAIVTGLIYARPPGRILDAVKLGAKIVLPQYKIASEKSINLAHRYGLKVVAWTVNTREDALKLVEAGVDGLASDTPDVLIGIRRKAASKESS
jgi:glycerophosphoryl diester phosphodiesterase